MRDVVLGPFCVQEQESQGVRSISIYYFSKPMVPTYPNLQWKPSYIWFTPHFGSFPGRISIKNGVLGPFCVPEQGSQGLRSIPIQYFSKPIVPTYPNSQWKPIYISFTTLWKFFGRIPMKNGVLCPFWVPEYRVLGPKKHTNLVFFQANRTNVS